VDFVYVGNQVTQPTLTCSNGAEATSINWIGTSINWNNPLADVYDIFVTATCGSETNLTASCGSLTVNPTLSCNMPITLGVAGSAITQPVPTCSDGSTPDNIVFNTIPPTLNWSVPAKGNYLVSVEAKCGIKTLNEICGNLNVVIGGTFTDTRDDKIYKWVKIGEQTWMAENLNYNVNYNGSDSKCYSDNTANCTKYGRLYTWATAMALHSICNSFLSTNDNNCATETPHQGICPSGWHLPSDDEWTQLVNYVGDSLTAGTKLKAASGWSNGGNGTDDYGFSALPGGNGHSSGNDHIDKGGYWWSSTEYGAGNAYNRGMYYDYVYVYRDYFGKGRFNSVRCVKD
jgi:uncharacterized protein (TIGR02145 family)